MNELQYQLCSKEYHFNGCHCSYQAAVNLMDDDLREELHGYAHTDTDYKFLQAYLHAHYERFGELFFVN